MSHNENLEQTLSKPATLPNFVSTVRSAATTPDTPASLTAMDNPSAPFILSQSELASLLEALRHQARHEQNWPVAHATDFPLTAALHARKGHITRTLALLSNYLTWRVTIQYEHHSLLISQSLRPVLSAGMFVIPETITRLQQPLLLIRYRYFNPRLFSPLNMARTIAVIMEYIQRTQPQALTHGVAIIQDMNGFGFSNIDLRMLPFLQKAFSQTLPVRIAGVFMCNPPVFIRALFALVSTMLSNKLKTRLRLFQRGAEDSLAEFVQSDQLPSFVEMGGTLEWTHHIHDAMVNRIISDYEKWEPGTAYEGDH